jgi:hypothetical protein
MKFEICTHTTHLLKTVVALPWTRNLLATSQLRPCTKLVEWLQESTSKSSSNRVGSTGNVGWRFTCEASVSLTQWTPRESTTAFAQILDAKFSGNKRPGTGPTPKENASAYQHQNNHPNFITVLWIPSCATFSWIHRDCHCIPCLRNWPSRVSCVPVCPSLMMQLLCLHHNHTLTIKNMTRLMDVMQDTGGTGPIKTFSSWRPFHLNNWSAGTAGTVSNCKFMLCHLPWYHPIEVKLGTVDCWTILIVCNSKWKIQHNIGKLMVCVTTILHNSISRLSPIPCRIVNQRKASYEG